MKDIFKQEIHKGDHLWRNSFFFSLLLMFFTGLYVYFQHGEYTLRMFNKTTAWVSIILIGLSLLLSSICYFFDYFDSKIIYRKQLGVWGFGYALFHSIFTLYLLQKRFNLIEYFSSPDNINALIFAILSLSLLILLAVLSNNKAVKMLGGGPWRIVMRYGGYLALFFGMMHFVFKRYEDIFAWPASGGIVPPIAWTLLVFTIFVFAARFLLWLHALVSKMMKKQPENKV